MAPTKKTTSAVAKKPTTHPTFLSMIQECVIANKEDVRKGVSRHTIKKFLADNYKLDMSSAANINNLSNAIKRGAEKGELVLPSGMAGRVKAAPKSSRKPVAGKENVAPKSAPVKKAAAPVVKKPIAKKATATKPAAKATPKAASRAAPKPAPKVAAKPTAKPAAKIPTKTAPARKPVAKKVVSDKKSKKTSVSKKTPAAKTAVSAKKAAVPKKKAASRKVAA
ncbi:uncharacterized protein L203_100808 [Cryptococcus depauperatus CBS 7841]|uniref:Histone H1 n=1 Tax=Cryptococcus depauperatus CBS 7841 TaxID=1295531 RepID=A0AAJ8JNT8_9TREE